MTTEFLQKGFGSNSKRIASFCEGISESEAVFRPYDKVNHLKWEMGHITNTRFTLIKLLSAVEKPALMPNENELFGNGSKPMADNYPTLEAIVASFQERGERIIELIGTTSAEHWASESFIKIPSLGITIEDQVRFFFMHESHHWGEISYLANLVKRLRVSE